VRKPGQGKTGGSKGLRSLLLCGSVCLILFSADFWGCGQVCCCSRAGSKQCRAFTAQAALSLQHEPLLHTHQAVHTLQSVPPCAGRQPRMRSLGVGSRTAHSPGPSIRLCAKCMEKAERSPTGRACRGPRREPHWGKGRGACM